jgi:3-oxoacyl-[acyl-carrier-protein] synthase III
MKRKIKISGTGAYLPEMVVDAEEMDELIGDIIIFIVLLFLTQKENLFTKSVSSLFLIHEKGD